MANFLTFEENQVLINNDLFPANGITLQLNANTVPVKDIYGNLLYYSPAGPIQGTVGLNFFLTGALPSYLRVENQDESPIKIAFNTIVIPDCYLTNVSLSVKPFEPIPVRADLVFYHGVRAMNTDPIVLNTFATNLVANGIAKSNNLFNSNLKTLNGATSYILTENRSSFTENPADFVVTDFDYQFSVERVPILRVGEIFPTRVAMKEANAEFSITANNIDGYLDIHGNTAEFSGILKDSASLSTYEEIQLTGIIVDQSYEISDESYGFSKIKMIQALNRKRSPITIPMEVSDPNIINAPTNNPINPPNTPPTTVIINEITEEKPKPQDPEKGNGTAPEPPPVDNDTYYYYTVLFDLVIYSLNPKYQSIITETLPNSPSVKNFSENNLTYKFDLVRFPINKIQLTGRQNEDGIYSTVWFEKFNQLGCSFKVNQNFKNNFAATSFYNNYILNLAFRFSFKTEDNQILLREYLYSDLNDWLAITDNGNGKQDDPYLIKLGNVSFAGVGNN